MAPPSKLAVATGSVQRLVKEEASYHKELVQQEQRIKTLESGPDDGNKEYTLRQEKQALQETKNVIPSMQEKIRAALEKLEDQLESQGGEAPADELEKANDAIAKAKETIREA